MSQPLQILGGLTAEQFLSEYWQKKPLLVRNALPEIKDLLEPQDIQELALDEGVIARLIQQQGEQHDEWKVKNSLLTEEDFAGLPEYWTLLIQAMDHYSVDLADLWRKFSFIPQWRRDDIMVSYAPKGGSVGKHFDFYDVFLVQGYGERRWQLGQNCDNKTAYLPNQPLKLLHEIDVNFDEILEPGDLLYVPPGLAHYGVAQNDCLTFSFGFRMPSAAGILDRIGDKFADSMLRKTPLKDFSRTQKTQIGEITPDELTYLKSEILKQLEHSQEFNDAVMTLMSEPKFPDNVPPNDAIEVADLQNVFVHNYNLQAEPASRLLYLETDNNIRFWANGEEVTIHPESINVIKRLANGEVFQLNHQLDFPELLADLAQLLNDSVLLLLPNETEEE